MFIGRNFPHIANLKQDQSGDYTIIRSELKPKYNAMVSLNGVNSEMYLSYLLSESAKKRKSVSVFGIGAYVNTKLSVYHYSKSEDKNAFDGWGDLERVYKEGYEGDSYYPKYMNINITSSDLKRYNIYAALLSSQT